MQKGASQKKPMMRRSIRFVGITDVAGVCGVSVVHLRMTLKGMLHDSGVASFPVASRRRSKVLEAKIKAKYPNLLKEVVK
jgi:hypothetical protein